MYIIKKSMMLFIAVSLLTISHAMAGERITKGQIQAVVHSGYTGQDASQVFESEAFFNSAANLGGPGVISLFSPNATYCELDWLAVFVGLGGPNPDGVSVREAIVYHNRQEILYEIDGEPIASTRGPTTMFVNTVLTDTNMGSGFTQYRIYAPGELSVGEHELTTVATLDGFVQIGPIYTPFFIADKYDPECQ